MTSAYWLSEEPAVVDEDVPRQEEPYATWVTAFYTALAKHPTRAKLVVPRPVVLQCDGGKSRWRNFGSIAKALDRDPQHMARWFEAEISMPGLLLAPSGETLTFPRKIKEGQVPSLLGRYMAIYVLCPKCGRGPMTLTKEPMLRKTLMACVKCGDCGAMPPILQGYRATSKGERRRERRKDGK